VIVQAGQSLSAICREHYGTARAEVVAAVSRFNQLADPDSLREGQPLDLPPLDQLIGKR
jgi:nucleoid-associated protein YgaU